MRACKSFAVAAVLSCVAQGAMAQEQPAPARDDLDVTMQIIVDPDAKLPDEVVRKIPLPARATTAKSQSGQKPADAAAKGQARAAAARELDSNISERAKERGQDASEQREQAGRSMAEEHRRNPPKPENPRPTPPAHP
ncbi:MAG: hypothetical protein ABW034_16195 [Steroidobacteraceae bacterium]